MLRKDRFCPQDKWRIITHIQEQVEGISMPCLSTRMRMLGMRGACLNVSLTDSTYEPEVMHLPKDSVSSSNLPSFYPFKIKNWTK